MKVFKILTCVLFVFVLSISCFASSVYDFLYISDPHLSEYETTPLDDVWLDDDFEIHLYPGVNYYISINVDRGDFILHGSHYVVNDSNNNVFIEIDPDQVHLDNVASYDTSYFDPSLGGNTRYFRFTVSERVTLNYIQDNDGAFVYLFSYNGQGAVVDAGNGVMSMITSFINECMLHWNLLLFCIVLPVLGFAVSIIISFRERRKEN